MDTVGEVVESMFSVGFTTAEQGFQRFKVTSPTASIAKQRRTTSLIGS